MIFDTGMSGLQAATNNLEVIGNNIANSATVGFKGSRANFGDIYAYGGYGSSGTAIGGGVMLTSVQQSFAGGELINTNNTLDLAISGNGFFVLNSQGATVYTRAGQFIKNDNNFITNNSGQFLTGYLANSTGQITGAVGNIQINMADISPHASTNVTAGFNLNSQSTLPAAEWAGGTTPPTNSYTNTTSMTVYDSLGNSHVLSIFFIMADGVNSSGVDISNPPNTMNQWYVGFQIDNQDVPPITGTTNSSNLYAINFNSDGTFSSAQDTSASPLTNNLIPLSYTLTNGANPLNLNIDLSNCTQFGSPFSTQSIIQDGFTTGSITGLQIDPSGIISGVYSNGQSMAMGQILLANFPDLNGLQNIGDACWVESGSSGQPILGTSGTGNFGTVFSGRLEQSNVDLTSELVNLISAQREFQANAQSIRAGDVLGQTVLNLT